MPAKILVIDDHEATRDLITTILTRKGYEVVGSSSGAEGLAKADQERPQVIVLDLMMPEMDGHEVCRRLRAKPELVKIPILMFTARSQVTDKIASFDLGADDYLVKPTTPQELLRRVETLIARAAQMAAAHAGTLLHKDIEPLPEEDASQLSGESVIVSGAAESPGMPANTLPNGSANIGTVVALLGSRGGVGTTILSINLATVLAEDGKPTTLIDLDTLQGHIGIYLKQKVTSGMNNLAAMERQAMSRQLWQEMVPSGKNLQLLLSLPNLDGQHHVMLPSQVTNLITALQRPNHWIVADLGLGLSANARAVLAKADHILLCTRPERVSLTAAKQLLQQIEAQGCDGILHIVLLDYRDRNSLPQSAIEHFLSYPVLESVKINDYKLAHAVNSGLPLVKAYPDVETMGIFRQIVQHLMPAT